MSGEIISILGGYTVVLLALIGFLGKTMVNRIHTKDKLYMQKELSTLKTELDKEIATLNSQNEQKIHVGKIQYEKEFKLYESIWHLISTLTYQMKALENELGSIDQIFTDEFVKLCDLKCELRDLLSSCFPFIEEKIYDEAMLATDSLHLYFSLISEKLLNGEDINTQEFKVKLNSEFHDFFDSSNSLSELIRKRNNSMIVV